MSSKVNFNTETEYGEPQAWVDLDDGTSIEITHEEYGLSEDNQFFSARHHCSDEDFENDVYHSTMGVIDFIISNNLDDIVEWIKARRTA